MKKLFVIAALCLLTSGCGLGSAPKSGCGNDSCTCATGTCTCDNCTCGVARTCKKGCNTPGCTCPPDAACNKTGCMDCKMCGACQNGCSPTCKACRE